jgi:hypothetical protein
MLSVQANPLHASSLQQELLQKIAHRTTSAQRLVKRAQIVLEALNPRVVQRHFSLAFRQFSPPLLGFNLLCIRGRSLFL